MSPGSVLGSRPATARAGRPETCAAGVSSPARAPARETGPGVVDGESSGGRQPQESTGREAFVCQGEGRAERTPGGSKASKRACRSETASPAFTGSGRHVRRTFGCVEATGLATARNRRPGSRAGAAGKAIVKHPGTPRRTTDGERTRTEARTRESGHGSPGRESSGGAAPGREPHETRRGGVGRTGEGLGRSSSHKRAHDVVGSGARTSRETDPAGATGRAETKLKDSGEDPTPRGKIARLNTARRRSAEEDPEVVETTRGERRSR
jgi:hypothetical protein